LGALGFGWSLFVARGTNLCSNNTHNVKVVYLHVLVEE
jgi:hypothetical protein